MDLDLRHILPRLIIATPKCNRRPGASKLGQSVYTSMDVLSVRYESDIVRLKKKPIRGEPPLLLKLRNNE